MWKLRWSGGKALSAGVGFLQRRRAMRLMIVNGIASRVLNVCAKRKGKKIIGCGFCCSICVAIRRCFGIRKTFSREKRNSLILRLVRVVRSLRFAEPGVLAPLIWRNLSVRLSRFRGTRACNSLFFLGLLDENYNAIVAAADSPKALVFALEKMSPANFLAPEVLDQLDDLGESVELSEGATVQVHPKLILWGCGQNLGLKGDSSCTHMKTAFEPFGDI